MVLCMPVGRHGGASVRHFPAHLSVYDGFSAEIRLQTLKGCFCLTIEAGKGGAAWTILAVPTTAAAEYLWQAANNGNAYAQ